MFDTFSLVHLRGEESPFEIELTINHGRTESYARGEGYGHVAVAVDDLDAEHARLAAAGRAPEPMKEFHRDGRLMARFFFLTDSDANRMEVVQRQGYDG